MISVDSSWNIIKEGDRVLYFASDISHHLSLKKEKYLREYRKTITSIFKEKPAYVIIVFPNISDEDDILFNYETFYGTEFQRIDTLDIFEDKDFKKYVKNNKCYYLNLSYEEIFEKIKYENIDKIIVDNIDFSKENFQTIKEYINSSTLGRCYIDDLINAKIYLGKIIDKIVNAESPLSSLSLNDSNNENDIVLILGKTLKYSINEYKSILYDYIKQNRITAIYSCNKAWIIEIRSWLKSLNMKMPSMLMPIHITMDQYDIFIKRIKKHSIKYTSFIFLGEFVFSSKDVEKKWILDKKYFKNNSIFDIDSNESLLEGSMLKDSGYRLTLDPKGMLKLYLELNEIDDHLVNDKDEF